MNKPNTNVAAMAAALAGAPAVEQEVRSEIEQSRLVSQLVSLRAKESLSQTQLAERMKCSPSKISRMESGYDCDLKWGDIAAYVEALDCEMSLAFDKTNLPAATRIKERVFQIHDDLNKLAEIASQQGDDKDLVSKIQQFFGEVLFNFLARYKDSCGSIGLTFRTSAKKHEVEPFSKSKKAF